jgi:hypothetical protein
LCFCAFWIIYRQWTWKALGYGPLLCGLARLVVWHILSVTQKYLLTTPN